MILEVFKAATKEEVNKLVESYSKSKEFSYRYAKIRIKIVAVNKDCKCDGYLEI